MNRSAWCALPLVAALTLSGCTIQTVGGKKGELTLHATFDYIQTLVVGHGVQISDIPVGTVTSIDLVKGKKEFKARVTFSVEDGVNVPKGTSAVIARTSIFGENYIKLKPPKGADLKTGPFLKSGDEITDARLAPDIEEIATVAIPVVAAFAGEDLEEALEQQEDTNVDVDNIDVVSVIKRVRKLLSRYEAMGPDVQKIVDGTGQVGAEFAKASGDFGKLLDEADTAVRTLNREEDRMVGTVKAAIELSRTVNAKILQPHADKLSTMLGRLAPLAEFFGNARKEWEYLIQWGLWASQAAPRTFHPVLGFLGYAWVRGFASPAPGTIPGWNWPTPGFSFPPEWTRPPWAPDQGPPNGGQPPEDDPWPGMGEDPPFEGYDPDPDSDDGSSNDGQTSPLDPGELAKLVSP